MKLVLGRPRHQLGHGLQRRAPIEDDGPYLLRAHLQGYVPARARIVQVNGTRTNWTLPRQTCAVQR